MRSTRGILGAAALAVLFGVGSDAFADGASNAVDVKGRVAQPATFTPESLAALPPHDVVVGEDGASPRRYRGVLLRDLITLCKPIEQGRFDLRQGYVVARATDGYLAVFSWAELFNSPIGDEVLVAVAVDGAPLSDGEGRIALVSGRDTRSGPRHVRWLASIEMRRAEP